MGYTSIGGWRPRTIGSGGVTKLALCGFHLALALLETGVPGTVERFRIEWNRGDQMAEMSPLRRRTGHRFGTHARVGSMTDPLGHLAQQDHGAYGRLHVTCDNSLSPRPAMEAQAKAQFASLRPSASRSYSPSAGPRSMEQPAPSCGRGRGTMLPQGRRQRKRRAHGKRSRLPVQRPSSAAAEWR